ncbi:hypothetical protein BJX64DRAFT_120543 [Aspergillus heterothallicus]
MGHKVSAVAGVKSDNFTDPGNAINEIWVGNTEVISRLPFGDSDMAQAGWPENSMPKIPWHNFIIPMKRDLGSFDNLTGAIPYTSVNWATITHWPADKLICCNQLGCLSNDQTTDYMLTQIRFGSDPTLMVVVWVLSLVTLALLQISWKRPPKATAICTIIGLVLAALTAVLWTKAHYVYELKTWDHLLFEYGFYIFAAIFALLAIVTTYSDWVVWIKISERPRYDQGHRSLNDLHFVEKSTLLNNSQSLPV